MFDSWHDYFKRDVWNAAFKELNIDPDFYTLRERSTDEVLPYDHISCGVEKTFLIDELDASKKNCTTSDCRNGCNCCGLESWCLK